MCKTFFVVALLMMLFCFFIIKSDESVCSAAEVRQNNWFLKGVWCFSHSSVMNEDTLFNREFLLSALV